MNTAFHFYYNIENTLLCDEYVNFLLMCNKSEEVKTDHLIKGFEITSPSIKADDVK